MNSGLTSSWPAVNLALRRARFVPLLCLSPSSLCGWTTWEVCPTGQDQPCAHWTHACHDHGPCRGIYARSALTTVKVPKTRGHRELGRDQSRFNLEATTGHTQNQANHQATPNFPWLEPGAWRRLLMRRGTSASLTDRLHRKLQPNVTKDVSDARPGVVPVKLAVGGTVARTTTPNRRSEDFDHDDDRE